MSGFEGQILTYLCYRKEKVFMKHKKYIGLLVMTGALICLCKQPVCAGNTVNRAQVMRGAIGFESILNADRTDEEFIQKSKEIDTSLYGYKNLGIANVENNLNIRKGPNESASLVGKLPRNCACDIIGQEGEWSHITSGDVEGYVKTEFLFTGADALIQARKLITTYAKVDADALKVRLEPSTDASVYTQVAQGEKLEYVQTLENGWVEVLLDDESVYVSGDYVTIEEALDTAVTMSQLLYGAGVSDVRVSICEYAKQFVGNRYVYGGSSLTNGTDCSGFTMRVFEKFGISLPHSSVAQAGMGTKISASDAKPGDLFFYGSSSGRINHVALYIGGGQVVHASSAKTGIKISGCNYRTPVKVVRIIQYD